MCLNLGYTSHEIGWYLNFRQSNVYGSSSHLFWIIHGRMQGTPLQTKPVMHISHEKTYLQQICVYIVHIDIYIYTYIYIYVLYYIIFNILGFPTFAFWDIVSKNLIATEKKHVVWNLPWPLQQVAPCQLAGSDPANTSVRPGNPRGSSPLSSWGNPSTTRLHPGAG